MLKNGGSNNVRLVFWHDAQLPCPACLRHGQRQDAPSLNPEANRRAPTDTHFDFDPTRKFIVDDTRDPIHHPVILTHSQDGTSTLSITIMPGGIRGRAGWHLRMEEGLDICNPLLVLPCRCEVLSSRDITLKNVC